MLSPAAIADLELTLARATASHPGPERKRAVTARVGIVSWNTAELLDRCLASLPAALGGLDASVVVVDNASADGSAAVAERHPGVAVIRNDRNVGYARAMNQALAGAQAEVLIALNPDTEPPAGSLAKLAERLLAAPDVGLVVPRLVDPGGGAQHSVYRFPSLRLAAVVCFSPGWLLRRGTGERWWLEGYADHSRSADIDWAVGAVHVLRAAAVDRQRPYDDRWFMYVEDLDLCWRLARAGWRRRLEADISVPHLGNAAGAMAWGDARTERWLRESLDWYARAHGRRAARAWALLNAGGVALRAARAGLARGVARREGAAEELAQLRRLLAIHLRAAAAGPPPPAPPP